MIVDRNCQIRVKSAHDHDPRPECLNIKLRHNGHNRRAASLAMPRAQRGLPWRSRAPPAGLPVARRAGAQVNALLTGPGEEMVTFMTVPAVIRTMDESDPETISAAFTALGWHKPVALYQRYLAEQEEGRRLASNQPVEPGATIRIDDDATLMLTRLIG